MGSTTQVTVTNGKWCVGTHRGSGIDGVRLEPFRAFQSKLPAPIMNRDKYLRPACYGKLFPTNEAATAYSVEHGFSQIGYPRPSAFITLKLSPATRRYLKAITNLPARWSALMKIINRNRWDSEYLRAVEFAPYMAKTRIEWNLYLEGDFAQLRAIRQGKLAHEAVKQILGDTYVQPTPMQEVQ